jgi:hypothetical protein
VACGAPSTSLVCCCHSESASQPIAAKAWSSSASGRRDRTLQAMGEDGRGAAARAGRHSQQAHAQQPDFQRDAIGPRRQILQPGQTALGDGGRIAVRKDPQAVLAGGQAGARCALCVARQSGVSHDLAVQPGVGRARGVQRLRDLPVDGAPARCDKAR